MVDYLKAMNFVQDFGCARLKQLQILYNGVGDNFNKLLEGNMISRKGDIFVHNTKVIDDDVLKAIELLCKFKKRLKETYLAKYPAVISFLTIENTLYSIIVANENNKEAIIKLLNINVDTIDNADKLLLIFPDASDLNNITTEKEYAYTTFPELKILNKKEFIENNNIVW